MKMFLLSVSASQESVRGRHRMYGHFLVYPGVRCGIAGPILIERFGLAEP